jgi:hypothetical protein
MIKNQNGWTLFGGKDASGDRARAIKFGMFCKGRNFKNPEELREAFDAIHPK